MRRTRNATAISALLFLLVSAPAAGAGIDTSGPVLCALTEAMECSAESECAQVQPEDLNLPPFVVVDVKGKKLSEHHGKRSSPIQTVNERNGAVYLQGFEQRAWGIAISKETGRMTASAAGDQGAFVIFGACTEP